MNAVAWYCTIVLAWLLSWHCRSDINYAWFCSSDLVMHGIAAKLREPVKLEYLTVIITLYSYDI